MDGQAQLDVGGEDANNRAEARGKILDLAIFTCFSSQEALWRLCLLFIKYGSAQFLCVLHFKKNSCHGR